MSFLSSGNASMDYANAMGQVGAAQGRAEGYEELYRQWKAHAEKLEVGLNEWKASSGFMQIAAISRRKTMDKISELNASGKVLTRNEMELMENNIRTEVRLSLPVEAKREQIFFEKYPDLRY